MAKLRKIQFYRNGQVSEVTGSTVVDLKSAYKKAEQDFLTTERHNDMLDGEILLYRFSYDKTVHTLVGVVHVDGNTHSLEVLANYDMLGGEISAAIETAINALDVENVSVATETDGIVTFNGIKQEDGKIATGTTGISLEKVAKTGAAADVSVADNGNLINATTVEGALAEIAAEIDGMYLSATDVVALNIDNTALQASKISESNGKVSVEEPTPIVVFNKPLSDDNNVATMADLTAAEYDGEKAIKVDNTTNKISLVINPNDSVLKQDADGLKTNISLQYVSVADTEGAGTHKVIQLIGTNSETPVVLGTVDATDFVKDSFLESANIVSGTWSTDGNTFTPSIDGSDKAIELVWKVITIDGDTSDDTTETTYINVESLVDAYTSGNDWIEIDRTNNTISHQTQKGVTTGTYGIDDAVNGTGAYDENPTFYVPELSVDAAGHITAINEKQVSIKLPAKQTAADVTVTPNTELGLLSTNVQAALEELQGDIKAINAVNWNGDGDGEGTGEIIVNDEEHTISHKQHTYVEKTIANEGAVKQVTIPQLTVNAYGHVTDIENKIFTIDCNVTTVSGTTDQIVVTPTEVTEDINYTVSLAKAKAEYAETVNDSFDDDTNTFTFIKNVETDDFGRVTKVETVTMSENWDCGTWV